MKKIIKFDIVRNAKDLILIGVGIVSASFGLKGFLLPNNFIDGGVTGISLLISEVTSLPLSILILIVNIPFIIMGFKQVSAKFAIKSLLAITGLGIALAVLNYPTITNDKLLISVFGGFFLGMGIGLCIRGGCVIDGTEILAMAVSKKTGRTIGDIILIFNIVIFSVAIFLLSVEVALYAILTYFSASKTLDYILHGIEEYIGVTIISDHHQKIKKQIIEEMGRGVTIYKGKKGLNETEIDILYTIVSRLETNKLKEEINNIDPNAFVIEDPVNDTRGGMIKKKTYH
ncbi:MAG: YitT family protein [Cytophagales bacterium]|nr:MAG: YitT family protein [Cytophagales bacterium]